MYSISKYEKARFFKSGNSMALRFTKTDLKNFPIHEDEDVIKEYSDDGYSLKLIRKPKENQDASLKNESYGSAVMHFFHQNNDVLEELKDL